ncbi:MAG: TolC family protein, partial [Bacteroidales bacterium]|nr:TolC family protein [Bacteroidales bacterium]
MQKFIGLIFILLIAIGLQAQNLWDLKSCIDYANENNLELKQQSLYIDLYKNKALSSKLNLLPSLNAGANQNFSFGRAIDPYTNEFISENVSSSN